jgi:hypothetical protein
MIRIEHDVTTGEIQELELNEQEIKFALKETKENEKLVAALQAEAEAKAEARAAATAKLSALGLTADDLKALLLG